MSSKLKYRFESDQDKGVYWAGEEGREGSQREGRGGYLRSKEERKPFVIVRCTG